MVLRTLLNKAGENKAGANIKEKPLRSLIKAISWRMLGTLDTILISWLISGNVTVAFSIGTVEFFTKTILYYAHERLWINIKWGK